MGRDSRMQELVYNDKILKGFILVDEVIDEGHDAAGRTGSHFRVMRWIRITRGLTRRSRAHRSMRRLGT